MSARHLPLRWGVYRDRTLLGLLLIAGGLIHLQSASTTNLVPLAVGSSAHAIGWFIMPARSWRRLLPVLPSLGCVWLLLTGPQAVWTLTFSYLGWLLVRHRPWRTLITVGPVLLNGVLAIVLWQEYWGMLPALAISAVVLAGCAWWAAAMDRRRASAPGDGASATAPSNRIGRSRVDGPAEP